MELETTMSWGMLIYLFAVGFLYMFFRNARALNHSVCFDHDTDIHHNVHAVLKQHPHGGTWAQFKTWLTQVENGH